MFHKTILKNKSAELVPILLKRQNTLVQLHHHRKTNQKYKKKNENNKIHWKKTLKYNRILLIMRTILITGYNKIKTTESVNESIRQYGQNIITVINLPQLQFLSKTPAKTTSVDRAN